MPPTNRLELVEPLLCAIIAHIELVREDKGGYVFWMIFAIILAIVEYRRIR